MKRLSAWFLPGHYYMYEEGRRRTWTHVLCIWGAIAIVGFYAGIIQFYHSKNDSIFALAQTAGATAHPLKPSPAPDYTALQAAIDNWIQQQPKGQWSVVAQDLNNPANRAEINAGQQYYMASIYKLFLTVPLAQRQPAGTWGARKMSKVTFLECVDAMLSKSDNSCGESIGNYVGWGKADKTLRQAGFTHTSFNNLVTTPADTAKLLADLAQDKLLDQTASSIVQQALEQQKYRSGIPAGCLGCRVLNKTGDLDGVTHDAAIITNGNAKYVLVIFSKGGSFGQIADLSRLVNSHLGQ